MSRIPCFQIVKQDEDSCVVDKATASNERIDQVTSKKSMVPQDVEECNWYNNREKRMKRQKKKHSDFYYINNKQTQGGEQIHNHGEDKK